MILEDDAFPWDAPPESPSARALRALPPPDEPVPLPSPRAEAELPRAHRPREKLFSRGATLLGLGELVALVIGSGSAGDPVWKIADRLVRRHGLKGLASLPPGTLAKEKGVGPAGAARLAAAFELGKRAQASASSRPRLTRPAEVYRHVADLARLKKEHLVGLYLDAQNGLIHRETISIGALNTTRTHPREILYPAIEHLALGFILVHNHPSGFLEPSEEDIAFTRGVLRAGELMGIELYDHLIVAGGGYLSLRERGVL